MSRFQHAAETIVDALLTMAFDKGTRLAVKKKEESGEKDLGGRNRYAAITTVHQALDRLGSSGWEDHQELGLLKVGFGWVTNGTQVDEVIYLAAKTREIEESIESIANNLRYRVRDYITHDSAIVINSIERMGVVSLLPEVAE